MQNFLGYATTSFACKVVLLGSQKINNRVLRCINDLQDSSDEIYMMKNLINGSDMACIRGCGKWHYGIDEIIQFLRTI